MRHIALSLAGVLSFGFAGIAAAIPVTSQECAPSGDTRTITIDPGVACIAKGSGNNSNDSTFQAAVSGWSFIGTEEEGLDALLFDVDLDQVSGLLTLSDALWQGFDEILVVLKVGVANGKNLDPDWALFSIESGFTEYSWSVSPNQGGALSHASLYGRATTSVPEPATLGLLGLGLLGVAVRRRRRV